MLKVEIKPQTLSDENIHAMQEALNSACGTLVGEDYEYTVTQENETTIFVQAIDEQGDEVY